MNNAQILRKLPTLEEKKKRLANRRSVARRVANEIANLEEQIEILEDATEVHDGIAINIHKFGSTTIKAVDEEAITRYAQVYQNAHNGWTWGLRTYDDMFGNKGEEWHGACFPDYDEVIKFAKDWVARATPPRYQAFRQLDKVLCD